MKHKPIKKSFGKAKLLSLPDLYYILPYERKSRIMPIQVRKAPKYRVSQPVVDKFTSVIGGVQPPKTIFFGHNRGGTDALPRKF